MLILGASADPEKDLAKFRAKQRLNFPLLSDPDHKMLESYGVWRGKKFMGRAFQGIVRSTFLIGPDGRLLREWRAVKVPGHAEAVLEAIDAERA